MIFILGWGKKGRTKRGKGYPTYVVDLQRFFLQQRPRVVNDR
jgi:hypothetical protein